MNEFEIINRFFAPLAAESAFGLKDDVALLPQRPGHDLAVKTDAIGEGVDFFASARPEDVARKALRVNLSDLAAKGAEPAFYLLNLTLPRVVSEDWLSGFAAGLRHDQDTYAISLLGGDTGAGPLSIAVTAFGFVPSGRLIRRSGAQVGDAVYVTGTIGDSGGGLAVQQGEAGALAEADRNYLSGRYHVPEPPVALVKDLRGIAHSSVDVSDGLIADLGHIASASGVRIVVEGERIPLSQPLKALWKGNALERAVTAGDDYQTAFTAAPGLSGAFTCIGRVVAGEGVELMMDGEPIAIAKPGYRHF